LKYLIALVFFFSTRVCLAQTCTGSVGDPMVNITFGSGSSFGPPLAAGTTSALNYVSSTCPPDGNYSILGYTSGCYPDVGWHTVTDHTGNPNGFFMLVNASYAPSDFYVQTISGLCQGTNYQFAAWLLNMCSLTSILPNLTFTIERTDGIVLASFNTGDIPVTNPAAWKQYGLNFSTPVGISTVVLRMRNNAPGGMGNDIALDDITFRPIGPLVTINNPIKSGDSAIICTDAMRDILLLSQVGSCYASSAYQWQISTDNGTNWSDIPGATGSSYLRTGGATGTDLYRLAVAQANSIGISTCRVVSEPYTIGVYTKDARTISIAQFDGPACEDNPIGFTAKTSFGGQQPSFQWQVNGNLTGADSVAFVSNSLATGDLVKCILTSSLPCNTPASSNSIAITVNKKSISTIDISICAGYRYAGHGSSGTYVDTFVARNGCDSIRTLHLTVLPTSSSDFDTTVCYGNSYKGYTETGVYVEHYAAANGCDSTRTIHLTAVHGVNPGPNVDTSLCAGDTLIFSPGSFDSYTWQDGSTNSSYLVDQAGTYRVTVSNVCGTATKRYAVAGRVCTVVFPSAFTPNDDGANDIFKVLNGYHLISYHCVVMNRWGQQVFESSDPAKGWDGKIDGHPASPGTYVWVCSYTDKGGTGEKLLKGTVMLVR
jgi:gliding motility-associated-like protein